MLRDEDERSSSALVRFAKAPTKALRPFIAESMQGPQLVRPINPASGNSFVIVGSGGTNFVMTSNEGVKWRFREEAEANAWASVDYSPSLKLFAAVAGTGVHRVMTSPDGRKWTARTAIASGWRSVKWIEELGLFVAVASSGTDRVMTSPDGEVWTARSASEANQWFDVTWSKELGLLVAVAKTGTHRVMVSANGIAWTNETAASASAWSAIAWSAQAELYVAVSTANTIMTSPGDGNWTSQTAPGANNQWDGILWADGLGEDGLGLYIAVGRDLTGDLTKTVMTSPNGTAWTHQTGIAGDWSNLTYSSKNGLLVAIADNGGIMTSKNAADWTDRTANSAGTTSLQGIAVAA